MVYFTWSYVLYGLLNGVASRGFRFPACGEYGRAGKAACAVGANLYSSQMGRSKPERAMARQI